MAQFRVAVDCEGNPYDRAGAFRCYDIPAKHTGGQRRPGAGPSARDRPEAVHIHPAARALLPGPTRIGSRLMRPAMHTESLPRTRLPPDRYALNVLTAKKEGSTLTMLSAQGVKIDTIGELIAAGLAVTSIQRVGRSAIEIKRVKITEAERRAL